MSQPTSVLELLGDHGLDPVRVASGRELAVSCPLCGDQSRRMYVNATTAQWICFKCEERGGIYWLCRKVLDLDHFEAMHVLDAMPDTHTPDYHARTTTFKLTERRVAEVTQESPVKLPDEYLPLTMPTAPGERPFWTYLLSRGVLGREVRDNEIGFCLTGFYKWRVIVPVRSAGVLWTFVARAIGDMVPKVLHPMGAQPTRALFGIDRLQTTGTAIITEGVFDAIKVGDSAVATLGTNVTPHQRDLLRGKGVKRVIFLFDGDEAGRTGYLRHAESMLAAGFAVKAAFLEEGLDPDTAPFFKIEEAIHRTIKLEDIGPVTPSTEAKANTLDFVGPKW